MNLGVLEKLPDGRFRLVLDIRYPVTDEYDWIMDKLTVGAARYDGTVGVIDWQKPLYLPEDHPLIATLMGVYQKATGRDERPRQTGGGTFARTMPNLVAFGPGLTGEDAVDHHVHNADEFVPIAEIERVAPIYEQAIEALLRAKLS